MSNRPQDSRGRWWEIRGESQPDVDGHRELMTDSRGRSRPERSLSVGANLADEPRHPSRAFLWPIVSVVAAVGLIVSVIYVSNTSVSKDKPTSPATAAFPDPAAPGRGHEDPASAPDTGAQRSVPPAPLGNLPGADSGAPPLIHGRADTPRGLVAAPGGPAGNSESPVGAPSGSSGGAGWHPGNQPTGTPTSSAAAAPQEPPFTLEGPAPAAPRAQQGGKPEPGTGGCGPYDTRAYACTIARNAPVYPAGTAKRYGPVPAGQYLFLCQSAGSKYSVENHANYWWAWVRVVGVWVWVPVVFLEGGPDNAPEPGLPVCGHGPTATAPPTASTTATPHKTPTHSAPTTTTTPTK